VQNECVTYRVIEEKLVWKSRIRLSALQCVDGDVFQACRTFLSAWRLLRDLRVVVFESALRTSTCPLRSDRARSKHHERYRPTAYPFLMDTFVRLTKAPVVSLARIRAACAA